MKPGVYHQFVCIEEGVAYELYWAEFNHSDIVRETAGYVDDDVPEDDTITLDLIDVNMNSTTVTADADIDTIIDTYRARD